MIGETASSNGLEIYQTVDHGGAVARFSWEPIESCIDVLACVTPANLKRLFRGPFLVVTEPGLTTLRMGQLLSRPDFLAAQDAFGPAAFSAETGIELLLQAIAIFGTPIPARDLDPDGEQSDGAPNDRFLCAFHQLADSFIESTAGPASSSTSRACHTDFVDGHSQRPNQPLASTRDTKNARRRVIDRSVRLRRLVERGASDIVIRNEARMFRQAIEAHSDAYDEAPTHGHMVFTQFYPFRPSAMPTNSAALCETTLTTHLGSGNRQALNA